MIETKITIEESQEVFIRQYSLYGFRNEDSLVQEALTRLQRDLEKTRLQESAELYAEIYAEDKELKEMTEAAWSEFPQ